MVACAKFLDREMNTCTRGVENCVCATEIEKHRRQWLCDLLENNKKLPNGTRIRTTVGGVHTGKCHELPVHVLESANKLPNIMSDNAPFWVMGWRDLHGDLLPPNNEVRGCRRHSRLNDWLCHKIF